MPPRTSRSRAAAPPARRGETRPREGRSRRGRARPWPRVLLALLVLLLLGAGGFWLSLPQAGPLRSAWPETTALIDARAQQARAKGQAARRVQRMVPLGGVSPWLQKAVVNSEDARFWDHQGFDWEELRKALGEAAARGRLGRGASTITQQLAKNLWLGEDRSLWRKVRELLLAHRLESLGKKRILELYLNVVEWGPGIYGAEAAARTWFKKPASALAPEEAAVLAAMLPSPRKRNPRRPSLKLRSRAAEVLELYGMYRQLGPEDLAAARGRLASLLPVPP